MPRFTSLLPSLAETLLKKTNQKLDDILIEDRMRALGIDRDTARVMVETEVKEEMKVFQEGPTNAIRLH